jgi:hypothetical protein
MAEEKGIRNPLERLERAIQIAEETRRWILKVNELRRELHLPREPLGLAWSIGMHSIMLGHPGVMRFYKSLYRDLQREGQRIPGNKRRILLMHLLPFYQHPVIDGLLARRCVIAMEEYLYIDWPALDPKRPFRGIAQRLLSQPQLGGPEKRINLINRLVEEYSIDGVVHMSHWGCRQSAGAIHAIRNHIARPFLNVETDLVDPDSASTGQLSTRVEGFLELLDSSSPINRQMS